MTGPESKPQGHTKGPWAFQKHEDFSMDEVFGFFVQGGDGSEIVYFDNDDRPETKANARLIAAAPEMLTTLVALEKWFDTDQEILDAMPEADRADNARQLAKIRAAIARARGAQ